MFTSDPTNINELVFPNDDVKSIINAYIAGADNFLLLYGHTGTGKSVAAEVILKARVPGLQTADIISVDASTDGGIKDLDKVFDAVTAIGFNESGVRALLVDEVDCVTKTGADALKGYLSKLIKMNKKFTTSQIPCIFTTNHAEKLKPAFLNRLMCVHWTSENNIALRARVMQVLANNNAKLDYATIDYIIKHNYKSPRSLMRALAYAVANKTKVAQVAEPKASILDTLTTAAPKKKSKVEQEQQVYLHLPLGAKFNSKRRVYPILKATLASGEYVLDYKAKIAA